MNYYEVAVRGSFGDKSIFVYESFKSLEIGQLVEVVLKGHSYLGVVIRKCSKPKFKTLAIKKVRTESLPIESIKTTVWMSDYYASPMGACLSLFLPQSLPEKPRPYKKITCSAVTRHSVNHKKLTKGQNEALIEINNKNKILIHGETGSGKTHIYGKASNKILCQGKSVLVLVPEIGMTTQINADLSNYWSKEPIIYHSDLTQSNRRNIWRQLLTSHEPNLVIGTRSALFLPINDLGLIVIDEAHDSSYKNDSSPRFQTLSVADKLADFHNAKLVIGTATPSVDLYFLASSHKKTSLIRIKDKASIKHSSSIDIVDKKDKSSFSRSPLISDLSIKLIKNSLISKEQVMLFINRRGTSKLCVCLGCGWTAECQRCNIPLAYHQNLNKMICHNCGDKSPIVLECPECHLSDLKYKSPGSQAVTAEVQKLFPVAKVARIDSDSSKHENLNKIYNHIYRNEIDILVGTQSIAKGLDIPNLTLGIIVDADSGIHLPDYLASERMYQTIHQVLGRIGRHKQGRLVVQTYNPNYPLLLSAVRGDYESFYESEIKDRKKYNYPPFSHIARVIVSGLSEEKVKKNAEILAKRISDHENIQLIGPSACFYQKIRNYYRWHIILKSKNRKNLTKIAKIYSRYGTFDLDPLNLL